jgi:hypothetical protein
MRIARYKSVESGHISLDDVDSWIEDHDGYVRLTHPVKVEFTDLPSEETVPKEVASLEMAKSIAQEKYLRVVGKLDERISKLMAIEDQS